MLQRCVFDVTSFITVFLGVLLYQYIWGKRLHSKIMSGEINDDTAIKTSYVTTVQGLVSAAAFLLVTINWIIYYLLPVRKNDKTHQMNTLYFSTFLTSLLTIQQSGFRLTVIGGTSIFFVTLCAFMIYSNVIAETVSSAIDKGPDVDFIHFMFTAITGIIGLANNYQEEEWRRVLFALTSVAREEFRKWYLSVMAIQRIIRGFRARRRFRENNLDLYLKLNKFQTALQRKGSLHEVISSRGKGGTEGKQQ